MSSKTKAASVFLSFLIFIAIGFQVSNFSNGSHQNEVSVVQDHSSHFKVDEVHAHESMDLEGVQENNDRPLASTLSIFGFASLLAMSGALLLRNKDKKREVEKLRILKNRAGAE